MANCGHTVCKSQAGYSLSQKQKHLTKVGQPEEAAVIAEDRNADAGLRHLK